MPKTIETLVYQFDELSDKAKERARQGYRDASTGDNYFAESVIDDAVRIAELIGIDIETRVEKWFNVSSKKEGQSIKPCVYWSGFWSQGDGACFVGKYSRKSDAVQKVAEYAPTDEKLNAIVRDIDTAANIIPCEWRAIITQSDSYYSHANTMRIEIEQETDENGDSPEFSVDQEKALLEAFRAYANWIYRQLESEYEYVNSDEYVDETIRANEYEFTETGERF